MQRKSVFVQRLSLAVSSSAYQNLSSIKQCYVSMSNSLCCLLIIWSGHQRPQSLLATWKQKKNSCLILRKSKYILIKLLINFRSQSLWVCNQGNQAGSALKHVKDIDKSSQGDTQCYLSGRLWVMCPAPPPHLKTTHQHSKTHIWKETRCFSTPLSIAPSPFACSSNNSTFSRRRG